VSVWWKGVLVLVFVSACAGGSMAMAEMTPVKLAVFPFELDDFSAAISTGNPDPADTAELARVTGDVRKLLQESGRYDLVAVAGAAAKSLRDCNGCDAPLAKELGAEQSFVGVVKRISRAEYQVHFQLRDAATGALIAEADTGLRMGAMDSWNRGAQRLVKDRLLKNPG
jgi:Tol biopolymer transport system component